MNSAPALYAGFIVGESRNLTGIATSYNSVAQSVDLCRAGFGALTIELQYSHIYLQ